MTIAPDAVGPNRPRPVKVVVVVSHLAMRIFIVELLTRETGNWDVATIEDLATLVVKSGIPPELAIVDTSDFPRCLCELPVGYAPGRLVVIGPEPDPAYRRAALAGGAGAWLSREDVANELGHAMRATLKSLPEPLRSPRRPGDSQRHRLSCW